MSEPSLRWENPGLGLTVYDDRLEITVRKRQQTLPISELSSVSVANRPKRLVITTAGEKRIELLMGPYSEDARAMIAHQLARSRSGSGRAQAAGQLLSTACLASASRREWSGN